MNPGLTIVFSLPQKLKVVPWSLHLTWIWGKQSGKLARLQEARIWRGEAPDSPWYGGTGGDKYLAMDLVQPQVGRQQMLPPGACASPDNLSPYGAAMRPIRSGTAAPAAASTSPWS